MNPLGFTLTTINIKQSLKVGIPKQSLGTRNLNEKSPAFRKLHAGYLLNV
jgi:hypothetical protein